LNFYDYDEKENEGRFTSDPSHIGSYDSSTVKESKLHLGVVAQYINDRRSNPILPIWGSLVNIKMMVYKGVGRYASDYAQLIPEFSFYASLDNRSSFVLAERFGGTFSLGKPAFYQSAFIGGQGNLQGYQQYRFAGQHSFYNNLELRVKLADLASYIVPGQYGFSLFWDVGKVWDDKQESRTWHHGTGAGIYFAPASLLVINFVMGHSEEGWLPYITMGFRF
jgi:outer membrane translocation and assembly module TamA